ncbi:unnamed protein product [Paramecium sonneborni]|uniref:Uncharacterized protein n=1 Tax=Paramecium sonneborni TaxID=65129 RepID=A0A8S1RWC3_9CILI|nr:unnamed protein product [Paramecium sonneborni]
MKSMRQDFGCLMAILESLICKFIFQEKTNKLNLLYIVVLLNKEQILLNFLINLYQKQNSPMQMAIMIKIYSCYSF